MRSRVQSSRRRALHWLGVLGVLALAGCSAAGTGSSPPFSGPPFGVLDQLLGKGPVEELAPPPPEKESCGTPAQCKFMLKKMVDDPNRGWVGENQAAAAYTDGTRLFAYRALRKKLSCRELGMALGEVRTVSKSLAGNVPGVSQEQLSRTRVLSTQVEGELAKEHGGRCRA